MKLITALHTLAPITIMLIQFAVSNARVTDMNCFLMIQSPAKMMEPGIEVFPAASVSIIELVYICNRSGHKIYMYTNQYKNSILFYCDKDNVMKASPLSYSTSCSYFVLLKQCLYVDISGISSL